MGGDANRPPDRLMWRDSGEKAVRSIERFVVCILLIVVASACRFPPTNQEPLTPSERVPDRQTISILPATSTEARDAFAGSSRCEPCHPKQYDQWRRSAHARTFDQTVTPPHGGDCGRCHVTSSADASVGCESCHGPQSTHARNPDYIEQPACRLCDIRVECIRCHTRSIDPEFVFANEYPKVKHDDPETE